jgi:hypothetical protein
MSNSVFCPIRGKCRLPACPHYDVHSRTMVYSRPTLTGEPSPRRVLCDDSHFCAYTGKQVACVPASAQFMEVSRV